MSGGTRSFGGGDRDSYLIKINPNGDVMWSIVWGGGDDDHIGDISLDSSDNIYMSGSDASYGVQEDVARLLQFNTNGALLANISWSGGYFNPGTELEIDSQGNVIIAGTTSSSGPKGYDVFIVKLSIQYEIPGIEFYLFLILTIGAVVLTTFGVALFVKKSQNYSNMRSLTAQHRNYTCVKCGFKTKKLAFQPLECPECGGVVIQSI